MAYADLVFDAAKSAIVRLRWFLLTTTLLSSLILAHAYLEKFGAHASQLRRAIAVDTSLYAVHRASAQPATAAKLELELFQGRIAALKAEEDDLAQRLVAHKQDPKRFSQAERDKLQADLDAFAEKKYRYQRTYNTLKDLKLRDRKLPLLEMEVDANDYLPLMAVILSVMIAAVWLSVGSLDTALRVLSSARDRSHFEACRVHFTFLFRDERGRIDPINLLLLHAAIWIPFTFLSVAVVLDLWPSSTGGILPEDLLMAVRWVVLLGSCAWSFAFAWLGTGALRSIKRLSYS